MSSPRIQILPPEEARKIAAGEVVDRPAALVREFLDNAIDAGGSRIETAIEEGGIRRVEVIDDGQGMGKEDLEICWYTHATSKIRSMEDLSTAETLGFRGEALAAAAAVARLEILTSADGREAWRLETGPGGPPRLEQSSRARGATIRALGLFDAIPARKRFLKREAGEGALCKQICIEKALAFPGISFRFTQDSRLKLFLPEASSLKERFAQAVLGRDEGAFLHEISAQGQGFSVTIVAGGPELSRQDRRQQYVFANGRRISDYSLLQALEYGLQGWFPNGTHPVGAVYVDIDPALADFNIHPAKREARFRDAGAIHHAVTSSLGDFSRRYFAAKGPSAKGSGGGASGAFSGFLAPDRERRERAPSLALEALLDRKGEFAPLPGRSGMMAAEDSPPYGAPRGGTDPVFAIAGEKAPGCGASSLKFVGRLFSLFILVEQDGRLYIIDQHAAHERLLYNRFLSGPVPRQELLVPILFTAESAEDDRFINSRREDLEKLGVVIAGEDGAWRIEALPANWKLGDAGTIREILNLKTAGENMAERWAATCSCHSAIKDGDYLDEEAALALAADALQLPVPRCPHGRPIWVEISREELFRAVKRL